MCVVLLLFLKLETLKIYRLKRKSKKKKRERDSGETAGKGDVFDGARTLKLVTGTHVAG